MLRIKTLAILLLLSLLPTSAHTAEIFPKAAPWLYFKATQSPSTPDTAWREPAFDDSSWTPGSAPFFYENDSGYSGNTELTDMFGNYTGIYMRKRFAITDRTEIGSLDVTIETDDGGVLWINGTEIARINAPAGNLPRTATALGSIGDGTRERIVTINNSSLVNGVNVIAVHALNASLGTSSDFIVSVALSSTIVDAIPPQITSKTPTPGTVSQLPSITVTFSEPVIGVNAADLQVDGRTPVSVVGSDASYTFNLPPLSGPVTVNWAPNHGITDLSTQANPFDHTAPAATWQYNVVDNAPPTVATTTPTPSIALPTLTQIDLSFTEPVQGVNAADLLINQSPATNLTVLGAGRYIFHFPDPPEGPVTIEWAAGHQITDLATPPNAFAGAPWSYTLDLNAALNDVVINEILAVNGNGLRDEDGTESDWIELHNPGTGDVNLGGWHLTDDPGNLTKWTFPPTLLPAGGYLIVFASDKDQSIAGQELHANFRLSGSGDYLALVKPGGTTITSVFSPSYPEQFEDISYGISTDSSQEFLITATAPARALVPANNSLEPSGAIPNELRPWTLPELDDSAWLSGSLGVGFDTAGDYLPLIGINLGIIPNATAYVRVHFNVLNPAAIESLILRLRYDDGLMVYLNGQEVHRDNTLEPSAQWNSRSALDRPDPTALAPVDVDISSNRDFLQVGDNVLAVQMLNQGVGSSDFLVIPELIAVTDGIGTVVHRYFPTPTPGAPNNFGVQNLGPVITGATHLPNIPRSTDNVVVTARVRHPAGTIASATLHYRVMYGSTSTTPMLDDGLHGDGAAGDGVYGGTIPVSSLAAAGQMVRWYITASDTGAVTSREPAFENTANSPEYHGTVVHNPSLTNALPVLHWFLQNTGAAETDAGTRCSLFYLGEFYDNLNANIHGQSSRGFRKKSFDIDFHPGFNFRYQEGEKRVDDINLLSTYPDKSRMRNMLAYGMMKDAGSPYHYVVPVRVERNGAFWGDAHIVENGDDNYLDRLGKDPDGALYKMYNSFSSIGHTTSGAEKKTRKQENNQDLMDLFNGLSGGAARIPYIYDNLNIPEILNSMAARTLTGDVDCCHKNYYFYRDSEGTGEWEILPWDLDLSFGRYWGVCQNYWDEDLLWNFGITVGGGNRLPDAVYTTPEIRQMYMRRLRTLTDKFINPPGTPSGEGYLPEQMDYWSERVSADAAEDLSRWGTYGNCAETTTCCVQSVAQATADIANNYLPSRRAHLYAQGEMPPAQPANAVVNFGVVEFNPASGNQDEEYFQLINNNAYAVDISHWSIQGAVDYTFQGGVVIPAGRTLHVAPSAVAFRNRSAPPRGGMGLFVQGGYAGQLSARGETLTLVADDGRIVNSLSYPGNPSGVQSSLRITEIMYHPPLPPPGSLHPPGDAEYIELKNIGTSTINISGAQFTEGVSFHFGSGTITSLAPDETVLVVKSIAAFEEIHGPAANITGQYTGNLDNGGERLRLEDASGEVVLDFNYNNSWHPQTDGRGFSLVIINENGPFSDWDIGSNWRPSGIEGGSPGAGDAPLPAVPPIRINEILSHSDTPQLDSIELHNPTAADVNIGGWFLSDDPARPKKYRIPNGTVLRAGRFLTFTEAQFNSGISGFALSSSGDEAQLMSGDAAGNLTGYLHLFPFGPAETGVPFGPHLTSVGEEHLVALATLTVERDNAPPRVGPVVISEIHYHPADIQSGAELIDNTADEFIELQNVTGSPVPLFDPAQPANTWQLAGGVDLVLPPGVTLPAFGFAILVPFDPANTPGAENAFRIRHGLDGTIPILGPFTGRLQNNGNTLRLLKPDSPDNGIVPLVLQDQVKYTDATPWPGTADGTGNSLQRIDPLAYGDDPVNWTAAPITTGAAYTGAQAPTIALQPAGQTVVEGGPAHFRVVAAGPGPYTYQWRHDGVDIPGANNDSLLLPAIEPAQAGAYHVMISNPSSFVLSSLATLTVLADTDGDGIPDEFENANGLLANDPADAQLDPDADGFTTLDEYLAGTDHASGTSFPSIDAISINGDVLLRFNGRATRFYSIEFTDSLTPPDWRVLTTIGPVLTDGLIELTDTSAPALGRNRYYRLLISK